MWSGTPLYLNSERSKRRKEDFRLGCIAFGIGLLGLGLILLVCFVATL